MTIQECYRALGGNFSEVSRRLPSLSLIEKFAVKFLDDKSYEELCSKMEVGNRPEAFRAAHTLKGVCANFGFDCLLASAEALTEVLRPEVGTIPAEAVPLMEDVKRDYEMTVSAIRAYIKAKEEG